MKLLMQCNCEGKIARCEKDFCKGGAIYGMITYPNTCQAIGVSVKDNGVCGVGMLGGGRRVQRYLSFHDANIQIGIIDIKRGRVHSITGSP